MPPAFNLSQDQTLQFNLCFVPLLAGSEEPSLTQNTDRISSCELTYIFCEHLIFKVLRHRLKQHRRTPSSAHTYRLLIVKEPACTPRFTGIRCAIESFCSSAAKKRNYVLFQETRQAIFRTSLNFTSCLLLLPRRFARQLQSQLLCGAFNFSSTTHLQISSETFASR